MNRLRNCKTEKVHISRIHWQSSKTCFIPRNHYLCTCANDLALVKSSTTGWSRKRKTSSLSREKTLFNLFWPLHLLSRISQQTPTHYVLRKT